MPRWVGIRVYPCRSVVKTDRSIHLIRFERRQPACWRSQVPRSASELAVYNQQWCAGFRTRNF